MQKDTVDGFLEACRSARRVDELLPELPFGMTQRDMRIVDAICQLGADGAPVRVGDVSERMGVTRPSVTRAIAGLEERGLVRKSAQAGDGRVVLVSATERGRAVLDAYVGALFGYMGDLFEDVGEERLQEATRTMREALALMAQAQPEMNRIVGAAMQESGVQQDAAALGTTTGAAAPATAEEVQR